MLRRRIYKVNNVQKHTYGGDFWNYFPQESY